MSCWLIFFCCCIWHTCNCLVSLLNRMFAFILHSEYTTSFFMAKSVVWHDLTSKQDRHFIVLFWTVILFNCLNVNMFCFVLSVRLQVSFIPLRFRYFGQRFSFCTVDLLREGRVVSPTLRFSWKRIKIHPLYDFHGKESKLFFADV